MASRQFSLAYPKTEPFNFLGLDDQNYQTSKVVVFPVPYSSTTYWKSGTKEGPRAMIEASRHIELWDHELQNDPSTVGIYTLGELQVSKNSPKETIDLVEKVISHILKDKKFPLMLGGEHSITFGAVSAASKRIKDLSILQLDAHSDSRFEFEGTKYHHACHMRRAVEDLKIPAIHVGIRSTSEEEIKFFNKSKLDKVFYAPDLPIDEIVASLSPNVYVTIDLDVFDTGVMPGVGTPEPGGLGWYPVLELLKSVASHRKVIGADVVELDPIPGNITSDFAAAKLAYKLIAYTRS